MSRLVHVIGRVTKTNHVYGNGPGAWVLMCAIEVVQDVRRAEYPTCLRCLCEVEQEDWRGPTGWEMMTAVCEDEP